MVYRIPMAKETRQTIMVVFTRRYVKDDLMGRLIIAVVNFPPRQIADFISEVLVRGIVLDDGEVVLIKPDRDAPLGKRVL